MAYVACLSSNYLKIKLMYALFCLHIFVCIFLCDCGDGGDLILATLWPIMVMIMDVNLKNPSKCLE